jgi:hypothetical protein
MGKAGVQLDIAERFGPSPVSKRLEAALREKAGDYAANRLLRDHRLPREEMTDSERKATLIEFIEAMTDFLGKEEAGEILVEVGQGAGAAGKGRARAGAR